MTAIVQRLYVYPMKSARAIRADRLRLTATGPEWDRYWMAADPQGLFMSQRTQPRLACIEPEIGTDTLTLRAPRQSPLAVPLQPTGAPGRAQVWKDPISALDQGEAAAGWLSEALGAQARLLRVAPAPDRHANAEYAGPGRAPLAFVDGFPILVVNLASLEQLNARMPEPVPLERFRPNVVLQGLEPFAEDRIAALEIGPVTLRLVKPCTRCVITSTDQQTGEPSSNPLPVLRQFRFDRRLMGVTFGENAVIATGVGSTLEVGAACHVTWDR
jgi:MOSC domain-containing protein